MSSSSPICASPQCDKPPNNGYLCPSCVATLRRDLKAIPDLMIDLEITISRQDKITESDGRSTGERPLPLRVGPMEARRDLVDTLSSWAWHFAQASSGPRTVGGAFFTAGNAAAFLLNHLLTVQVSERAGECADEIGYMVITAQRAVDKPLQLVYVGPCDKCTADLYAHPRAKEVACREDDCDAIYDIAARREWLLEQAEDQLLTATEMSRALPSLLGAKLTAAMVRGYAHRGRITQFPPHPEKPTEPRYKVKEVIDYLRAIAEEVGRPKAS